MLASFMLAGLVTGSAVALPLPSPVVSTGAATLVTTTGATVAGVVNPSSQATTYQFDYGTTMTYGQHSAAQPLAAGATDVPVSAALAGLAPATTYHFRVEATNASGTTLGLDKTFSTAAAPTVSTGAATAITASSAALAGTVNPAGVATTYAFQYGTTTAYGAQTATQSAGAGTADVPVSAALSGLGAATHYHYRLVATRGTASVPGTDAVLLTPGPAAASALAVSINPAGGNTDLATALAIGSDAAGTPVGQASAIAQALAPQFANQLAAFGTCAASKFDNVTGPTAANCPDRTAILGVGKLVTRDQAGAEVATDQGFLVKTAANGVVFWWHTPAVGATPAGFGEIAGVVTQETGLYGPVVSYDLKALPVGARVKQLTLDYQRSATNGKSPFVASSCVGGSWGFQARIAFFGGVPAQLPATTVPCGAPAPTPAPEPSKLQLARATIFPADRVIDILAPITRRASGNVSLELYAAGQRHRWTAPIDAVDGRIRNRETIPAAQAALGTGILTIRYAGDADTRPQVVRLRAANVPARLDSTRPTLTGGHLLAHGTVDPTARGVVRVQLEYYSSGKTTTLQFYPRISGGAWNLNATLSTAQQTAIAQRQGTVESYILFTGYLPRRMRGEMIAYQVLGAP
ncbi:MAG: hypothetical protein ACR2KV_15095 [Solirubrobacteraceae bacterium]